MIRPNPRARAAAIALAILSAVQLAVGIAVAASIASFLQRQPGDAQAAFADAVPLIVIVEIVKLLAAVAQILVVRAVAAAAPAPRARMAALVSGIAGALLMAASGLLGLYAAAAKDVGSGALVHDLALAALGATGVFALVLLSFEAPRLRRWHAGVTLVFALACLLTLFVPGALFAAVPLGCIFWLGLAGRLRHR
ncbi:MAG TPA: hypothetical protein VF552_15080 [Allosphingosinicella sp.]|jgi:hypothetical protein